jgi:hypothetical protein
MGPRTPRNTAIALALAATFTLTVLLAAPLPAAAHGDETRLAPGTQAQLADARRATARFHDIAHALSPLGGYGPGPVIDVNGIVCIDKPGVGAMGVHYPNFNLFNAQLDERRPQALIYEPQGDGTMRLVGVEYIVLKPTWDAARAADATLPATPKLFKQDFHLTDAPNRYGLPAFYALHVWLWQPNPEGLFADWNPSVRCP